MYYLFACLLEYFKVGIDKNLYSFIVCSSCNMMVDLLYVRPKFHLVKGMSHIMSIDLIGCHHFSISLLLLVPAAVPTRFVAALSGGSLTTTTTTTTTTTKSRART
jgi:hypothetical protein